MRLFRNVQSFKDAKVTEQDTEVVIFQVRIPIEYDSLQ